MKISTGCWDLEVAAAGQLTVMTTPIMAVAGTFAQTKMEAAVGQLIVMMTPLMAGVGTLAQTRMEAAGELDKLWG